MTPHEAYSMATVAAGIGLVIGFIAGHSLGYSQGQSKADLTSVQYDEDDEGADGSWPYA